MGKIHPDVLLAGFENSYDRLRTSKSPEEAFAAIFEALNWVISLDFRFGEDTGKREKWLSDVSGGSTSAAARVLQGVRYARNSVHHQWADALELTDGAEFPLNLRGRGQIFGEWRWKSGIPEPINKAGKSEYVDLLVARPSRLTLEHVAALFVHHRELIGLSKPEWFEEISK